MTLSSLPVMSDFYKKFGQRVHVIGNVSYNPFGSSDLQQTERNYQRILYGTKGVGGYKERKKDEKYLPDRLQDCVLHRKNSKLVYFNNDENNIITEDNGKKKVEKITGGMVLVCFKHWKLVQEYFEENKDLINVMPFGIVNAVAEKTRRFAERLIQGKVDAKEVKDVVANKDIFESLMYKVEGVEDQQREEDDNKKKRSRVCLNMIVKNESWVIRRCLSALTGRIDYWVILDTGSEDGTQNLIEEYMASEGGGVPGELHENEFVNFGVTRTEALRLAQLSKWGEFDYVLFCDADMCFVDAAGGKGEADYRFHLRAEAYQIVQNHGKLSYFNLRLLRRSACEKAKYVGATHEYLSVSGVDRQNQLDPKTVFFTDFGDGGCKADKFERDKKLLENSLKEDPNNPRTLFYLAQTYKNSGNYQRAIDTYKRHTELQTWEEEVYYSLYMIGQCHEYLGETEKAVYWGLKASEKRQKRGEALYMVTRILREKGLRRIAWDLALRGLQLPEPTSDLLFVEKSVYQYRFKYEISILAFYMHPEYPLSFGMVFCDQILLCGDRCWGMSPVEVQTTQSNLRFYLQPLKKLLPSVRHVEIFRPQEIVGIDYVPMNPSMVVVKENSPSLRQNDPAAAATTMTTTTTTTTVVMNIRCVNYFMDDAQHYHLLEDPNVRISHKNPVRTVNCLAELDPETFSLVSEKKEKGGTPRLGGGDGDDKKVRLLKEGKENMMPRYRGTVQGLEDLRLVQHLGRLFFLATSQEVRPDHLNQMVFGEINLSDGKIIRMAPLQIVVDDDGGDDGGGDERKEGVASVFPRCEKNWMPFSDSGSLYCYYDMQTLLRILDVDDRKEEEHPAVIRCEVVHRFKNDYRISVGSFRGGAPPVRVNGRLYCLIHEVIITDGGSRLYCHRLLRLANKEKNFEIERVTYPFRIRGTHKIEYAIGMVQTKKGGNDNVLISWGERDQKAFVTSIPSKDFVQFVEQASVTRSIAIVRKDENEPKI